MAEGIKIDISVKSSLKFLPKGENVHYVPDFFEHRIFMLIKCDISDAILSHSATHDQHLEKYNRIKGSSRLRLIFFNPVVFVSCGI